MIIDFRVRPPFAAYIKSPLYTHLDEVEKDTLARTDSSSPRSAKEFSMELLFEEAQEAGIDKIVVPVRRVLGDGNPDLVKLVDKYPDKIIGLAGIDVADINSAIDDIKKYVVEGCCRGIVLEPGQDKKHGLSIPNVYILCMNSVAR